MQTRTHFKKIRIGEILVSNKTISEAQLKTAVQEQKRTGRRLGNTLIDLGLVTEEALLNTLAEQLDIPYIDLKHYKISADTVRILPEIHSRRYRAVVLAKREKDLLIGMADPTDIFAYDKLNTILRRPLSFAIVSEAELIKVIDQVFRRTEEISSLAVRVGAELSQGDYDVANLQQTADVSDAPIVQLIQSVFKDAVNIGASDIHFEPDEKILRVRQRVDGLLSENTMPLRIAPALATRLKLMASMDISEKRLPQDGRFSIKVENALIDVRVSTMPGQHGESIVMRLLNQSAGLLNMPDLGMPEHIQYQFTHQIKQTHGLILVTGPTGSGKTTTLYAALNLLNTQEKKIITIEDPVEYRLPRITQVQVHEKIHLDFSDILRAAMRQDPDILLIGEMRDQETVQIGIRAAMTGHLVLSTLHTNNAIATAPRLLDMGAEGYLLAATLRAVMSQRLVRRICERCATVYNPTTQEQAWLHSILGSNINTNSIQYGAGCRHCNNTGYLGRIGTYELLETNRAMMDALRNDDNAGFVQAAEKSEGFTPITNTVLNYVLQGTTTLFEAQRITGEMEEDVPIADEEPSITEALEEPQLKLS
jgi:MSHA biogenesis protein MshE